MSGRKLKLTRELIKQFEGIIELGCNYREACKYLNVAERTFFRWMSEGEQASGGIKRQFWQTIKASEAKAEIRNLVIIQKAAETNWKAACWFLERRFPQRWGKKNHYTLAAGEAEPIDYEFARNSLIEKLNAIQRSSS